MPGEEEPKPLVETSVTVDGGLQARLTKKLRVGGLCGMIVGAVLLLCYIVCSAVSETFSEEIGFSAWPWFKSLMQVALWGGAFLFAFGLILFVAMRASVKNVKAVYRNVYRFYGRYVFIETEREGEEISTLKLYYADLMKALETKDFFLLYNTPSTCFAVEKRVLSEEEAEKLRGCLPIKRHR